MAKQKGRADRKRQRQRAEKARERGLPQAEPAPLPARTRKAAGDVVEQAMKSGYQREGVPKPGHAEAYARGFPVFAKVALGALAILVVVYALSHVRKSKQEASSKAEAAARTEQVANSLTSAEVDGTATPDPSTGSQQDSTPPSAAVSEQVETEQPSDEPLLPPAPRTSDKPSAAPASPSLKPAPTAAAPPASAPPAVAPPAAAPPVVAPPAAIPAAPVSPAPVAPAPSE